MNAKAATLLRAFAHIPRGSVIVEIGCVRQSQEVESDGFSTVYLAQTARDKGWTLYSVDNDAAAVATARDLIADLPAEIVEADGAEWLEAFPRPISGLYLDGSANPAEALAQYSAATLAPDAVIVIDDIQPIEEVERGKGDLLLDALVAEALTVEVVETEPGYLMAVAR